MAAAAAHGAGHMSVYQSHRQTRAMYADEELHVLCLELVLHLLGTPAGLLDQLQLPKEPSGEKGQVLWSNVTNLWCCVPADGLGSVCWKEIVATLHTFLPAPCLDFGQDRFCRFEANQTQQQCLPYCTNITVDQQSSAVRMECRC